MSLTLIAPPAQEPVSLAELKEHIKVDHASEDAMIAGLGVAARFAIEARFGLAIIAQSWRLSLDGAPAHAVTLPMSPVIAVDAVGAIRAGVTEVLAADRYDAQSGLVGRVRIKAPLVTDRSIGGVVIAFTAGWADAASTPEEIKLAVKVLAAHFYENREAAGVDRFYTSPVSINALLAPYRQVRL